MNQTQLLHQIKITRTRFVDLTKQLTLSQLNSQAPSYSNSIGWNYAHVIATQQLLTYGLHQMPFSLPEEFINTYRKGTKPQKDISQAEINTIHIYAIESIDRLEQDINAQKFIAFNSYQTSYGVSLNTFEDALAFLPIHEALHLGMCLARKKTI